MSATRVARLLAVVLGVGLGTGTLTGCATNPATGRREISLMSEAQEISIGREQDAQVRAEMGVVADQALQQYVSRIGLALAQQSERPGLPWQFTVVDSPAVNAFALPGGFIYITRGILPFLDSEAELAGVLGHEIGHVTARHAAQQYTRSIGGVAGLAALGIFVPATRPLGEVGSQALSLLFLKYGREDELQADGLGVRYTARGGWDPAGVPGMLSTLGRLDEAAGDTRGVPNWLATHPEPLVRVREIAPQVAEAKAGRTDFRTDPEALLQRIDGLVFGDNPEQGVVRGRSFLHPVLRLAIEFPDQWPIQNAPAQVVAKAPTANHFLLLEAVPNAPAGDLREIALAQMRAAGFEPRSGTGSTTPINDLPAYVQTYAGQMQNLGAVLVRGAHVRHAGAVYFLAGLAPADSFATADPAFLAAIRTFRALTASQAGEIHPNRIDLYVVRTGDTWASIAARAGGVVKPATLAIMNHADPASTPAVGRRIKTVVVG